MFLINKNLRKNESGMTVVEASIYLPLLILAYIGFIVVAFYVTQRVVLDSAVSRVCVEAAAFLSDEPKIGQKHPFTGVVEEVYANPYARRSGISYRSLENEENFKKKIEEKVLKYSAFSLIEGRLGVGKVVVSTSYQSHVIFGELTINAEQSFLFPINFKLIGLAPGYTFKSTAKSMVINMDAFVNDIDLIFDAFRWAGFDLKGSIQSFGGAAGAIGDVIANKIKEIVNGLLDSLSPF